MGAINPFSRAIESLPRQWLPETWATKKIAFILGGTLRAKPGVGDTASEGIRMGSRIWERCASNGLMGVQSLSITQSVATDFSFIELPDATHKSFRPLLHERERHQTCRVASLGLIEMRGRIASIAAIAT